MTGVQTCALPISLDRREFRRHGAAQIRRECGDAAFPRQIIAEERNLADGGGGRHEMLLVGESLGHQERLRHGVKPYLRRRVEPAGRLGERPAQSCGS